ncbi:MAG: hypothetical protein ACOCXJ_05240, partial [Planctomycetota bacterium]
MIRLRIRLDLSRGDRAAALRAARDLFADDPREEANAVLLAETLVADGHHAEALRVLDLGSLPEQPGLERLLWGVCLRLELQGPVQAFSWLG